MSSKLDQSLEEIAGTRRNDARRTRRGGKPRTSVGGVTKNTAAAKPAGRQPKAVAAAAAAVGAALPTTGESKIIVSNLPSDVTEVQIKEYFTTAVGPIKKVLLNYNKNGRSVGVATIIFSQPQSAAEAAKKLDSVKVDGKPMRIEVILGAKYAPAPVAPKSLGDRIQGTKAKKENNKPKPAAAVPKPANAAAGGAAKAAGRGGRKGRAGRPKPKTVEELDAEMSEYFDPNAVAPAANTNGAPAPAAAPATGDATMEDEIM
ncbi:unnamed protein product [Aureobasidium vineae]|uniref:RRM domain-containing protein n=1 Tax=Aureobasidium vineae TaxID=2773715 RepID=A0A9N8JIH4_9PEZI|nr:unnamed protein product [Aureobasidium vineae]